LPLLQLRHYITWSDVSWNDIILMGIAVCNFLFSMCLTLPGGVLHSNHTIQYNAIFVPISVSYFNLQWKIHKVVAHALVAVGSFLVSPQAPRVISNI